MLGGLKVVNDKKRIKVAIVLPEFNYGGAERMVAQLASNIDQDRFEVKVYCLCGAEKDNAIEAIVRSAGVSIEYIQKPQGFSLTGMRRLSKRLSEYQPDIVHSHAFPCLYCIPWIVVNRRVLLHTIHTSPTVEVANRLRRIAMSRMYSTGKAVAVTISESNHAEAVSLYHIDGDRIEMVYNPVDCKMFERRVPIETKSSSFSIICVASLIPVKNHTCLLNAFKDVLKELPEATLTLVGAGVLEDSLKSESYRLGIDNSVHFLGVRDDIPELLWDSDMFVLSSLYEGLPLSVLEAMAAGLPIVATDVGGLRDLVKGNGILVPPDDVKALSEAIVSLGINELQRIEMSEMSVNRAKAYDIGIVTSEYERLYVKYGQFSYK